MALSSVVTKTAGRRLWMAPARRLVGICLGTNSATAIVAPGNGSPPPGSPLRVWYTSVVLSSVYPDVSASAACVRTHAIVQGLAQLPTSEKHDARDDNGTDSGRCKPGPNRVCYATSADLTKRGIPTCWQELDPTVQIKHLPPNRSNRFAEEFMSSSGTTTAVDLVVFDRFFVEEAHSFRFREAFPKAALVLDMQDMHSLRWGRQRLVEAWDRKQRGPTDHPNWDPLGCLPEVLDYLPNATEPDNDRFLREMASIQRSDLVLVCSPREQHWLATVYGIPEDKLVPASFFVKAGDTLPRLPRSPSGSSAASGKDESPRVPPRFVFCGGFKHAPNADAVRVLIDFVWPRLLSDHRFPKDATLHIYGAFCPDHLLQRQHRENERIFIHGYEPDLSTIFGQDGGILLAPLRFGAGIKGKIVDAWTFGMPVVTTPVGSEGMTAMETNASGNRHGPNPTPFGGSIASNLDDFCDRALGLATQPRAYREAQDRGRILLEELFGASRNWNRVQTQLLEVLDPEALARKRSLDLTRALVWHQSLRSTDYFSRWIELKEEGTTHHDRNN